MTNLTALGKKAGYFVDGHGMCLGCEPECIYDPESDCDCGCHADCCPECNELRVHRSAKKMFVSVPDRWNCDCGASFATLHDLDRHFTDIEESVGEGRSARSLGHYGVSV